MAKNTNGSSASALLKNLRTNKTPAEQKEQKSASENLNMNAQKESTATQLTQKEKESTTPVEEPITTTSKQTTVQSKQTEVQTEVKPESQPQLQQQTQQQPTTEIPQVSMSEPAFEFPNPAAHAAQVRELLELKAQAERSGSEFLYNPEAAAQARNNGRQHGNIIMRKGNDFVAVRRERRTERKQFMLTKSLMDNLTNEAIELDVSLNELLNQILAQRYNNEE